MRVVVFEDDTEKWETIADALITKGARRENLIRIRHITEFLRVSNLGIDMCILDMKMPGYDGGAKADVGSDIISMLEHSGHRNIPLLAITSFFGEMKEYKAKFEAKGCIIYDYDNVDMWTEALGIFLAQSRQRGRYAYLIFVAIEKELHPYKLLKGASVFLTQRHNLTFLEIEANGVFGAAIQMPRMGLVNASATVSRILEIYSPQIVAMSGICAGIGSDVKFGQLLVTDIVWEYQSGKWLDEIFSAEPYQVSLDARTRSMVEAVIGQQGLLENLELGGRFSRRPEEPAVPKLAIFATGSAVIASQKKLNAVRTQHRKVSGLDMELFGFHRAVELSGQPIPAFSSKVVVDMADNNKGDHLHEYGSWVSATFSMRVIEEFFAKKT